MGCIFFKIKNEMAAFLGGFGCLGSQAAFFSKQKLGIGSPDLFLKNKKSMVFWEVKSPPGVDFSSPKNRRNGPETGAGEGGRGLRVATLFAAQSQATVTHRYEWFFWHSPGVLPTFSRKWCVAFFKSLEHQFSVSPPRFERTSNPVWRH